MSRFGSLNQATLIGRLGDNPEIKYTAGGAVVANFSIATERYMKKGEDYTNVTTWHKIVAWGKNAEFTKDYLKKGSLVMVIGFIDNHTWEHDGQKRFTSRIQVEKLQLLEKTRSADKAGEHQYQTSQDDVPF